MNVGLIVATHSLQTVLPAGISERAEPVIVFGNFAIVDHLIEVQNRDAVSLAIS